MISRININAIKDNLVRTALARLDQVLRGYDLGYFKTYRVNLALSAAAYPATLLIGHSLGQAPTDFIQTYVKGGTATWNIDAFTPTQLSVTISAALTVRGFAGIYRSDQ